MQLVRLRAEDTAKGVRPVVGTEWPTSPDEAAVIAKALQERHAFHAQRQRVLADNLKVAEAAKAQAHAALDEAVSAAYKSQALQQHPDKRRSGSSADTMKFQRMKTAYETLKDPELRRRYIDMLDHDRFIAEQAATQAAATAAESAAPPSRALRIGAGVPNRCTCPTVEVVSDVAVLLQWTCRRAAEFNISGYEVQGSLLAGHPPVRGPWQQLTDPAHHIAVTFTATSLAPGEWVFRVRAWSYAGAGDFSMASEGVLLGGEGAADPEAIARRAAEAAQRAAARKAEAQEAARDSLARWTSPTSRHAPDVLDQLSRAVTGARRAGLPIKTTDATLIQQAEDALKELRHAAVNRAVMAEWRPKLRDLSRRAASQPEAADEFTKLIERMSANDDLKHPGVRDTTHQLIKRTASEARAHLDDGDVIDAVVALLHASAGRTDVWGAHKIEELQLLADELHAARQQRVLAAARQQAAEARQLAKQRAKAEAEMRAAAARAEAHAAAQAAAQAEAAKRQGLARAQRDAELAAKREAERRSVPAPAPFHAAAPSAQRVAASAVSLELDCPVCLDPFCSGERKEPISFPCGHTVCTSCLEELRVSHRRCPSCREVRWPALKACIASVRL